MNSPLDLDLNIADRRAQGRLTLVGSTVMAGTSNQKPLLIRNGTTTLAIRAWRPSNNGDRDFENVDLATATVRRAIGKADLFPSTGTLPLAPLSTPVTSGLLVTGKRYFIKTFVAGDSFTNVGAASNASGIMFTATGTTPTTWTNASALQEITADLSVEATAAEVQTALNATAAVTALGGVTVTKLGAGSYEVLFTVLGAQQAMEGPVNWNMTPGSVVSVSFVVPGSATVREIQLIRLLVNPYAYAEFTTPLPVAAYSITTMQGATVDLPATKRITLDPQPYDGHIIITLDDNDPFEVPFNASAAEIRSEIGELYEVSRKSENSWDISGVDPAQDVAITVDVSKLVVPLGVSGEMPLNTVALHRAFAATTAKTITLLDQVDITWLGELPQKVYQGEIEIARDILDLSTIVPTPIPASDYAALAALIAAKQPMNAGLSALAALTTTAWGRVILTLADPGALQAYASLQPANGGLTAIAALVTAAFGRSLLTAANATAARSLLALDQVNNTSDTAKPVSTAQQAAIDDLSAAITSALALKAPLASPALSGTPTAPTAANATSNTQIASTAFVHALITDLIGGSPATLNAINELAAAIGNDPNFATTVATSIASKLSKASNLSDLTDVPQARINLGLGNVDDTSDADKPVSAAAQTALNLKANDADVLHLTGDETVAGEKTFVDLQHFNSIAASSVVAAQLANPGAPTVTAIGNNEGATWSYKIVAKLSDGTASAAGPVGSTSSGDETLDATNRNSLTWAAVPGAHSYDVYRTVAGASPATLGKIANVTAPAYVDTGAAGDGSTAPATNATGSVTAEHINGENVTGENMTGANVQATDNLTFPASTIAALGSASPAGRIKRVTDGPAAGTTVMSDGTQWRGLAAKGAKIIVVTESPYNVPNDDTGNAATGINAAIVDAAAMKAVVYVPDGKYRLTSGITVLPGAFVEGSGFAIDEAGNAGGVTPTAPTTGTWFHVVGTGFTPFTIVPPGQNGLRRFGVYHDQPAPGPAFAPTIYPYVIKMTAGNEIFLEDLLFLNPSHGIGQDSSGGTGVEFGGADPPGVVAMGRLNINNLYMNVFRRGVHLEFIADVPRINNVHFWTFYSARGDMQVYTRTNADGFYFLGIQNPQLCNISGYALDSLFVIDEGTSKLRAVNVDADSCNRAVEVIGDSTWTEWVNIRGGGGLSNAPLIDFQGSFGAIDLVNLAGDQLPAEFIKVTGQENKVNVVNPNLFAFGLVNGAAVAINNSPTAGSNYINIVNGFMDGAGTLYGGTAPNAINRLNSSGTNRHNNALDIVGRFQALGGMGPVTVTDLANGANVALVTVANTGGGAGTSASIDFANPNFVQPIVARFQAVDDGNYSNHIDISTHTPGAPEGVLVKRARWLSNGGLQLTPMTNPGTVNTIYMSSADGKLHAIDAAGVDRALW